MKTSREHFKTELDRNFPKTPESFRLAVEEEVYAQLHAPRRSTKIFRPFRILAPVAACLVLIGGTVAAGGLPVFQNWLNRMQSNKAAVEKSIIHAKDKDDIIVIESNAEEEREDTAEESGLFTVTNAYYDGSTLMLWVDPRNDYFNLSDHVYINGIDSRLEYVDETEEGSGIYECKITVLDEELQLVNQESINVDVKVYTDSTTKEDFSFTIKSDKLGSSAKSEGSVSGLGFGSVTAYSVTVAPSSILLHLELEIQDETMAEVLGWGDYILADASGNRLTREEWLRSLAVPSKEYDSANNCTRLSQDLEIVGFDASSPTMTLIPVYTEWDADGNAIPESERILEDMAFTIKLVE